MVHAIYGPCGSGKSLFAYNLAHRQSLVTGLKTAVFDLGNPIDRATTNLSELFTPEDMPLFTIQDCSKITVDDIVDRVKTAVSENECGQVVIDEFSMIDGRKKVFGPQVAMDKMAVLRRLHELDITVYVTVSVYANITNNPEFPPLVPSPYLLINDDTGMIKTTSRLIERTSDMMWFRVGAIDFIFDPKAKKIVEWFDVL